MNNNPITNDYLEQIRKLGGLNNLCREHLDEFMSIWSLELASQKETHINDQILIRKSKLLKELKKLEVLASKDIG